MATHYKKTIYQPEVSIQNPFNLQDKIYGELLGEERRDKIVWRIIAVFLLLCVPAAIGALVYTSQLPKTVPVYIAVLPWGEAQYIGDVSTFSYKNMQIPTESVIWQVHDFLYKFRTIPNDSDVLYKNVDHLYSIVTKNCEAKMTAELRTNDPFAQVGRQKRFITVESTLRLSTNSWQVDWIETASGIQSGTKRMRGVFTTALLEPPEKKRVINPLGIYIDDYDFTEISAGGNK